jgi:hypothetical protein
MKAALLAGILAISTMLGAQVPNLGEPQASQGADLISQASTGAAFQAELIRGLDVRKAKPGDAVVARCEQDFTLRDILIPRNAKLVGHVLEAQRKGRGNPESTLGIAFERAIMRDGREIPLTVSIQALAPPSIMAAEAGDADLRIRNTPAAKPRTSPLFPGAIKTSRPETSASADSSSAASTTGVLSLNGLQLESTSTSAVAGSVIHSNSRDVRLESGTRLILRVSLP